MKAGTSCAMNILGRWDFASRFVINRTKTRGKCRHDFIWARLRAGRCVAITVWEAYRVPLLTIDLREGFHHDTVVIHLNGKEVYRQEDVTTRLQIGFADRLECSTTGEQAQVKITLPTKEKAETIELKLASPTFLGVNLTEGEKIDFRHQSEPFGYV